jgi:hypothetical protein
MPSGAPKRDDSGRGIASGTHGAVRHREAFVTGRTAVLCLPGDTWPPNGAMGVSGLPRTEHDGLGDLG